VGIVKETVKKFLKTVTSAGKLIDDDLPDAATAVLRWLHKTSEVTSAAIRSRAISGYESARGIRCENITRRHGVSPLLKVGSDEFT